MTNWCETCQRHKFVCECELPQNIYVVEYILIVYSGEMRYWCQEKVRCIAFTPLQAECAVLFWAMNNPFIWWAERGEPVEHQVPEGRREIQIGRIEEYAHDIGASLAQCPLPPIFPNEE